MSGGPAVAGVPALTPKGERAPPVTPCTAEVTPAPTVSTADVTGASTPVALPVPVGVMPLGSRLAFTNAGSPLPRSWLPPSATFSRLSAMPQVEERSDERRVGKEGGRQCRVRGSQET